jgi:uncharacterized iron-regulated membrane protein
MFKMWLLRIHRWITLIFALPLAILILTGLVLSFEPMVAASATSTAPLTAEAINAVLAEHDPDAKALSLVVRAYASNASIGGAQRGAALHVDLARNEQIASPGALAELFTTSRRLHETFLMELGWLVSLSTSALLALIAIGVVMGLPRLRNTVAGWHKGTGWLPLPLLIASPLTGLLLAYGVTFTSPLTKPPAGAPVSLREAMQIVGSAHDLANVVWIRPMAGALRARVNDGGEMRVFTVTQTGLVPTQRNWPRLIHEGNWGGNLSALINVVISAAFITLMSTGLLLWARRKFRRRSPRLAPA